ncbi:MAG: hypothetical protein F4207_03175 [Gemmatimonadetes bacterium]|nr:hypothetical protein [Gemmatimonadota bacterium]MYG15418.1 hypothetical protein [Gemmatimonadota bacterium]
MLNEPLFDNAIALWRTFVERHGSLTAIELDELEERLRVQAGDLQRLGLPAEEAFQVAVGRISRDNAATRAFVQVHAAQLMGAAPDEPATDETGKIDVTDNIDIAPRIARPRLTEFIFVLCLAAGAALAIKVPALFGYAFDDDNVNQFYALNISFFAFPFVTAYFAWKRGMDIARWGWLIPPFFVAALLCNVFPFEPGGDTAILATLHVPIALWLFVGFAYAGGDWRTRGLRMDFVRFSGQLFILYVLIALGGGVLTGITLTVFNALGVDLRWAVASWIIPCGAMGAFVVAAWLVDTGQGAIEQVAPVLTRIFTPLFTLMLLSFLAVLVWTGRGIDVQREMLIAFDALLIVVLGLVLYSVSARDPVAPPGVFDGLQIALVSAALVVDVLVLAAMTARISDYGVTPNRMWAMGLNIILFVNLAWTARLYIGFLRRRGPFSAVERWQTDYLPVFSVWAAFVVAVFPLIFGYR